MGVGKGGVGKTALATTLAGIWAAEHGLRVLLVDADAQADATLAMGVEPADQDHGRSFVDAVSWGDPLEPVTVREGLDLVAAGREISRLAQFLVTEPSKSSQEPSRPPQTTTTASSSTCHPPGEPP